MLQTMQDGAMFNHALLNAWLHTFQRRCWRIGKTGKKLVTGANGGSTVDESIERVFAKNVSTHQSTQKRKKSPHWLISKITLSVPLPLPDFLLAVP